jgi:hypothetical protein
MYHMISSEQANMYDVSHDKLQKEPVKPKV